MLGVQGVLVGRKRLPDAVHNGSSRSAGRAFAGTRNPRGPRSPEAVR